MDPQTTQLLIEGLIAVAIGLFVGLEREHSDQQQPPPLSDAAAPAPAPAARPIEALGVRTFALLSLLGWVSALVAAHAPWFPVAGLIVVGALIGLSYLRTDVGLTTEFAGVAVYAIGMLVHHQRSLAIAIALSVTLLLIAKPWFQQLVPKLRRMDLVATLQLLIVLAIVLPLLPTEARDPWGVLAPRRIGLFVALIASISYVGYLLNRVLGQRRGAGLTGLIGGLASSTAVTAAMAQLARASDAMIIPGQLATLLANGVMPLRVLVVAALISRTVARAAALPLGLIALVLLAGAAWKWRQLRSLPPEETAPSDLKLKNPFALVPALKWGVLLSAILVASAVAQQYLGQRGLFLVAAASGMADVDAINLTVSRQAATGVLPPDVATLAITIAVVSNTVVKAGIALFSGGRRFGLHIALIFAVATAAGVTAALLLW